MTREAALMGIPTWSLFAGETPAVDKWLQGKGMLKQLTDARDLAGLRPRTAEPHAPPVLRVQGARVRDAFVDAVVACWRN